MLSNIRAVRLSSVFISSLFLVLSTYSSNAIAATFTVNSVVDAVDTTPGDGGCSAAIGLDQTACTLRAAIMETNALAGADTIMIPSGTYQLSIVAANEDAAKEGDLDILDDLVIVGNVESPPVIDGMSLDRVFDVRGGIGNQPVVEMRDIKITNGKLIAGGYGGGINNNGILSLSNVVLSANTASTGGAIYVGVLATLYLSGVTIQGNTATVNGGGMYSDNTSGNTILLNSTITGNNAVDGGGIGGIQMYVIGGSIDHNTATNSGAGVNVKGGSYFDGVLVDSNSAGGSGGGFLSNSLHLNRVVVSNNTAFTGGGLSGNIAEIVDSAFSGNFARTYGGGVYGGAGFSSSGTGTIRNSLFARNRANQSGGGIYATGSLNVENVTVSANQANGGANGSIGNGGGIYVASSGASLGLLNSTVIGNFSTDSGNNIYNYRGAVSVRNSIITGGATDNCAGTINTLGYNIDSGVTCNFPTGTDKSNTDPLLGALVDNGGVTMTHALQANSSAIDGVLTGSCPEFDQRHFVRSGTCDIGAYEYNGTAGQPGTLQFELVDYSVAENIGNAVINVTRTGGKDGTVAATWKTIDQTARNGSDYTAGTGTLTWANGDDVAQTISIAIIDDAIVEPMEKFNVYLLSATNGAQIGVNKTAAVSILDNDARAGTLQFSAAAYSGNENAGEVTITVTRAGGSNGAVSVNYTTTDGTAIAGQDYTAADGTIMFADGDAVAKTFKVSIIDDTTYEGNETVKLALSNATAGATLGTAAAATLTIIENDLPKLGTFTLDQSAYTVAEGVGKITFTVNRSDGADTTVVVPYTVSPGTALSPSDYTGSFSGMLSFAPGETSHTFDVAIIDDAIVEPSETFTVGIGDLLNGGTLGTPASATVTITDNDVGLPKPGTFAFSTAAYSVAEDAGKVTITVNRTNGADGAVDVPYVVTAGKATQDADYSGTYSGTLTFAAGEASRSFDFNIVDDVVVEPVETFSVTINSPSNGGALGALSYTVVTINDNDSSVTPTSPVDPGPTTGGGSGGKSSGGGGSLEPMFAFGLAFLLAGRGVRRSRKIIHEFM